MLAAYTCTPLVKIPVSDLKAGAQVKGVTISDLGSGNQPLDMVPYKKDGHEYILIANRRSASSSSRPITSKRTNRLTPRRSWMSQVRRTDKIAALTNVRHLTQFDAGSALILTAAGGGGFGPPTGPMSLHTIALP